mgnify:CR=1 FL=1
MTNSCTQASGNRLEVRKHEGHTEVGRAKDDHREFSRTTRICFHATGQSIQRGDRKVPMGSCGAEGLSVIDYRDKDASMLTEILAYFRGHCSWSCTCASRIFCIVSVWSMGCRRDHDASPNCGEKKKIRLAMRKKSKSRAPDRLLLLYCQREIKGRKKGAAERRAPPARDSHQKAMHRSRVFGGSGRSTV